MRGPVNQLVGVRFWSANVDLACESGVACCGSVAEVWGVVGGRPGDAEASFMLVMLCLV